MTNDNWAAGRTTPGAVWALIACVVLAGGARAEKFPDLPIPPSDRVLTVEEVKNFWINTVRDLPIPNKPNGLHPEAQKKWRQLLERRRSFIVAVRAGTHDIRAELVQLEHNSEAWRLRGDEEKAEATTKKLREFKEHLARLELLEVQRRAAAATIKAARQLEAIEAEISALRASCTHACCAH